MMYIPQDSPLVQNLLTSWWPVLLVGCCSPHAVSAEVGCQIWMADLLRCSLTHWPLGHQRLVGSELISSRGSKFTEKFLQGDEAYWGQKCVSFMHWIHLKKFLHWFCMVVRGITLFYYYHFSIFAPRIHAFWDVSFWSSFPCSMMKDEREVLIYLSSWIRFIWTKIDQKDQ